MAKNMERVTCGISQDNGLCRWEGKEIQDEFNGKKYHVVLEHSFKLLCPKSLVWTL